MATHTSTFAWESRGQRILAGYIVHGAAESQAQLSMHTCHQLVA